jgi:hypothetical protein
MRTRDREQPLLADELGRRQVVEPTTERRVRVEERERDIVADDGGDLEEALVLLSKPVGARCQHHLDGGRELDRLGRLHQPILSALARQPVRFTSVRREWRQRAARVRRPPSSATTCSRSGPRRHTGKALPAL